MSSINAGSDDQEPRVMEMASMKTRTAPISTRDDARLLRSTAFDTPAATPLNLPKVSPINLPPPPPPRTSPSLTKSPRSEEEEEEEESSDREALSCESTTSSTSSSSTCGGPEEHRVLMQSLYCSLSSLASLPSSMGSDSGLSYSTLEDKEEYYSTDSSTDTRSSSPYFEDDYSDDGHYKLIQLPESKQEYFAVYDSESDEEYSSAAEIEYQQVANEREEEEETEKGEFCVQCHVWPDVRECADPPRRFYKECSHTQMDPLECAFGVSVHFSSLSLSFVDENPAAAAKRKAVESVLRGQFYLLIQQFSVNPEKVARTLYGISVIDLSDLAIATAHILPSQERGKVLAVTLVRRLWKWPDLFGDVCKVLTDIPAMQEANAKVRQLLYDECSEDQYSKLLELTAEHHEKEELHEGEESREGGAECTVAEAFAEDIHLSHSPTPSFGTADNFSINIDIIREDSVSSTSRLSGGRSPEEADLELEAASPSDGAGLDSEDKPSATHASKPRVSLRLHESCLENRSIRSLDAVIAGDVDIDGRDKNGRTALIVACICLPKDEPNERITHKQRKKIRSLLSNGADCSIQDYDGNTALHIAALRRDEEVVKMLLDRQYTKLISNIAVTNKNSRTPLHYACYWGDMELVLPLLEREREVQSGMVNVRDRNGDTGLHIAARGGFKAVVKELLKVNANKDIRNMDGKTAADAAVDAKHNGVARLMRERKSRWLFSRRKSSSVTASSQTDGAATIHRSSSNSSLESNQNFSEGESDLEQKFYSDDDGEL